MFRKIFDLDPKEVEAFIEDLVKKGHKDGLESFEYDQWLKDYQIEVQWHPTYNEFYVQIEPNITTKDYDHWYFKDGEHELTAGQYFKLAFGHEHYCFGEIYGLMTGNTVCYSTYGCIPPNCDGYNFIINKEYAYIIYNKIEKKYYLEKWDEATHNNTLIEIVGDTSWIETCIREYENDK